jgi:hypothetical protein
MSRFLIVRRKFHGPRRRVAHELNRVAAAEPIDGLGDREGNLEIAAAISAQGAIEMPSAICNFYTPVPKGWAAI